MANFRYLCYWYILLVSPDLSTDSGTGASKVGKKTQCALLSQNFNFQYIFLNNVFREKFDNQTYLHAKFLKACLAEKVNVLTKLTVSLLKRKINEEIKVGKKWSIVHGFPESMRELLKFKKKVNTIYINRTLLISAGTKNELYIAFKVLSEGNTPAFKKARPILKWSEKRAKYYEEGSRLLRWDRRYRKLLKSSGLF